MPKGSDEVVDQAAIDAEVAAEVAAQADEDAKAELKARAEKVAEERAAKEAKRAERKEARKKVVVERKKAKEAFSPFMERARQEMISDGASPEAVAAVEFALNKAQLTMAGDPVGTVLMDDETDSVAHRVIRADGVPVWYITTQEGDSYVDIQPSLAWDVLYAPEDDE